MSRVTEIAVEIAVGVAVGVYTGNGINTKVNRLAQAAERIAGSLEAIAAKTPEKNSQSKETLPITGRRHITLSEEDFIMRTGSCAWESFVGSDGQIYPEDCRPPVPRSR